MGKKKGKKSTKNKVMEPKHFGYVFIFILLAVGFVYSRMRRVELQYNVNKIVKNIELEKELNKKLKAEKADLMSPRNLKKIANRFNLKEPSQKQIIVIPNE